VRELREGKGMTQEQLGLAIGELLGKPWPRQTVSSAEAGRRAFTAVELVAIAMALGAYVGNLFTPSPAAPRSGIELGPGVEPDSDEVMKALLGGMDVPAARAALTLLIRSVGNLGNAASGIQANAQFVLDHLSGGGSPVVAPSPKEDQLQPVAAAIVTSASGVLIGQRQDGKPPWTFIAGEVEPGEDAPFAAAREVKEETGLEVEPGEEIGRRVHPKTGRTMIYIAAKPVRPDDLHVFVGDERELADVRWVSLAEADELLPGMYEPVREHLAREIGE
jgi:8-oxo-dGTP pyrophosphatase MutT (NUDIX family)/transcriptional regulator with XRE-family HTH domain